MNYKDVYLVKLIRPTPIGFEIFYETHSTKEEAIRMAKIKLGNLFPAGCADAFYMKVTEKENFVYVNVVSPLSKFMLEKYHAQIQMITYYY
jgi:hypothetical protein